MPVAMLLCYGQLISVSPKWFPNPVTLESPSHRPFNAPRVAGNRGRFPIWVVGYEVQVRLQATDSYAILGAQTSIQL